MTLRPVTKKKTQTVWESQGPEGKVRGSAQQIFEKYRQMAQESSDPIRRETYRQWAEHYHRLIQDTKPKKIRRVVRVSAEGGDFGETTSKSGDALGPRSADPGKKNDSPEPKQSSSVAQEASSPSTTEV